MNGAGSFLFVALIFLITFSTSTADDDLRNDDDVEFPEIYIKNVDLTKLPDVRLEIDNITCPDIASDIFTALQLFTHDDIEQFQYYNRISCQDLVKKTSVNQTIFIHDDHLAFFPTNSSAVVYIDYAVAYVWLAEVDGQGYVDSPVKNQLEFDYPPPFFRPKRSFSVELTQKPIQTWQSRREKEIFDVITFPAVFYRAQKQGVVVTFPDNFTAPYLQQNVLKFPQISVALTIFLTDHCLPDTKGGYCSVFHAVKSTDDEEEDTPQLFLTRYTNELVFQVIIDQDSPTNGLISYKTGIFLNPGVVNQILLSVDPWHFQISVAKWQPESNPSKTAVFQSREVYFDQRMRVTSGFWPGYWTFGGSDYFPAFTGFIDSATVFRTRFMAFEDTAVENRRKLSSIGLILALRLIGCDHLRQNFTTTKQMSPFVSSKNQQKLGLDPAIPLANFTNRLYQEALEVFESSTIDAKKVALAVTKLSGAGCLGSSSAEFLLGVLKKNNFFGFIDPSENIIPPVVHYLKASLERDHFADLALGNTLLTGNGKAIPKDPVAAFRYIRNAAEYSQKLAAAHHSGDRWIDSIHLNNEEELATHHDSDDSPLLTWLMYQAGMGDGVAAHDLARLFYLGAQGVDRNVDRAADLFRQAADADVEEDPELIYDYAVVLLHGRGVEKNRTRALELLHKAAKMGYGAAYGAIGWYYMEEDGGNLTLAVPYLEKAAELGVPEAAHNIGYMLLNNLHPANPGRRPGLAYGYFLKAAALGSLEGALMASDFLAKGIPSIELKPDITEACRYAHSVANQSPRLGVPLRSAIRAYVAGKMQKSFLHYAIAAETGNDVAIFNTGYLCETEAGRLSKKGSFHNKRAAIDRCVKTMYEWTTKLPFSSRSNSPSHALLWLAHEAVERDDLDAAAVFYADALLAGADEGYYQLAWLAADRGYRIPESIFRRLIASDQFYLAEKIASMSPVDVALFLLDACMTIEDNNGKQHESDDDYDKSIPEGYFSCSLYSFYIKTNQTRAGNFFIEKVPAFLRKASRTLVEEVAMVIASQRPFAFKTYQGTWLASCFFWVLAVVFFLNIIASLFRWLIDTPLGQRLLGLS